MRMRVKPGRLLMTIVAFAGILVSCELGRNIPEPESYPLLGPLNITNGQVIANIFNVNGTVYHKNGIESVSLFLTEISNSNTVSYDFNYSGGKLVSYSYDIVVSNFGAYRLNVYAQDTSGATTNTPDILLWYRSQTYDDVTPPTLVIKNPTNNQVTGKTFQISGKVWDDYSSVSGVFWSLDGTAYVPIHIQTSNFMTNITLTTPGIHTNRIYSRDGVGNLSTTNQIVIDYQTGIPYISIDQPGDLTYLNSNTITISGIAGVDLANLSSLALNHNQGEFSEMTGGSTWFTNVALLSGTNTFQARVIADNGLTNFSSLVSVILDTSSPTLTITTPTNDTIQTQANFQISGTASDDLSGLNGIYLAVDDFDYSWISSGGTWSRLVSFSEGPHTIRLFALDNAGNSTVTNTRNVVYTNYNVPETSMTIYYYNYKNWSNPKIYAWLGAWEPAGSWSGDIMSNTTGNWFAYTFQTNTMLNIIFSDEGNDQTINLSHDGTGWYKSGEWYTANPDWLPQTAAAPAGGYFTNTILNITLSLQATNLIYARYTIDGSQPGPAQGTDFSDQQILPIGSGMNNGDQLTLRLWVTNEFGEQHQTYIFSKTNELPKTAFLWENATVYFAFIDRFYDGNSGNNEPYGRSCDSAHTHLGKFHGGDVAGLTQKLNEGYFTNLGINVIWITCPMEQMHGWVEGGDGAFEHYGYHGYYPMDWTKMDANFGTTNEFKTFVDTAHAQGIRILMDIVMNHTGYAPIVDLDEYSIDVLNPGWESASPGNFHPYINYSSPNWPDWWGPEWIRTDGLPGYDQVGSDNYTGSFSGLTDLKTESTHKPGSLPNFYANKPDTRAVYNANWTVREYLIQWITEWVEIYGIDGFRCDTAKHVEMDAWLDLKTNAVAALRQWKQNNPSKKLDDLDFWMTGEHWNWGKGGISKTWDDPEHPGDYVDYITSGAFDSMINFDVQDFLDDKLSQSYNSIDGTYSTYASLINNDPEFNTLSYLSSHDTILWYEGGNNRTVNTSGSQSNPILHNKTANYFYFLPGAIQIFYGEELGRQYNNTWAGTDADQKTRSFMPWGSVGNSIHQHWQILGRFRNKHLAVGAGQHNKLADSPYTFSRIYDEGGPGEDKVIVVMGVSGSTTVNVAGVYPNGTQLRDYYTGATQEVTGGQVTFTPIGDIILLEKAD